MSKLIFSAVLVTLLSACSGMATRTGDSSGVLRGSTMGASGAGSMNSASGTFDPYRGDGPN